VLRKSWWVLTVVVANVLVLAALLEVGTRLVQPFGAEADLAFLRDRHFAVQTADVPAPHRNPETPNTEFFFQMAIHPFLGYTHHAERRPDFEMGFPGGPKLLEAAEDRVVVAVSGGSVAERLCTSRGSELESALSRIDAFEGKTLAVLCLALSGYKQPQQLMTLNYLLTLGGHFDVWINLDGFNEIVLGPLENRPQGVAMVFPRRWDRYSRKSLEPAVFAKLLEIAAARVEQKQLAQTFAFPLAFHSRFLMSVWYALDNRREREIVDLHRQLDAITSGIETRAHIAGPFREYASRAEMLAAAEEIWQNASRQMSDVSRGAGIRYLHLLQPNQYLPGSKPLSEHEYEVAYTHGDDPAKTFVQEGYPLLIDGGRALRAQGVSFYDLTQMFRSEERSVYVDACCHLNALGTKLLADEVAAALEDDLQHSPANREPQGSIEARPSA